MKLGNSPPVSPGYAAGLFRPHRIPLVQQISTKRLPGLSRSRKQAGWALLP